METLPNELKREILLLVDYTTFRNLCQTNATFRALCADESLWHQRFQRDFLNEHKGESETWHQAYDRRWRWEKKIEDFAEQFFIRYSIIGYWKLLNNQIIAELIGDLKYFMREHHDTKTYTYNDLTSLSYDLLRDASALHKLGTWEWDRYRLWDLFEQYGDYNTEIIDFLESMNYHLEDEEEENDEN